MFNLSCKRIWLIAVGFAHLLKLAYGCEWENDNFEFYQDHWENVPTASPSWEDCSCNSWDDNECAFQKDDCFCFQECDCEYEGFNDCDFHDVPRSPNRDHYNEDVQFERTPGTTPRVEAPHVSANTDSWEDAGIHSLSIPTTVIIPSTTSRTIEPKPTSHEASTYNTSFAVHSEEANRVTENATTGRLQNRVSAFKLISTNPNLKLETVLTEHSKIDMTAFRNEWAIVAICEPEEVGSVEFFLDGKVAMRDTSSPYSLCGDEQNSLLKSCNGILADGTKRHTLTAITVDTLSSSGYSKTLKFTLEKDMFEVFVE
eukprot:Nk52_evm7s2474 gene=Nk52_evmTU7s2474